LAQSLNNEGKKMQNIFREDLCYLIHSFLKKKLKKYI